MTSVPFNSLYAAGNELAYIQQALAAGQLAGSGAFGKRCSDWLAEALGSSQVHMTTSGTAALEMAMLLSDVGPGSEVIMPSFNFVSSANAVVLRGGVPVFVDVRPDTLNLDETLVAEAITARTVAIVPVHYAGVSCEMDAIMELARAHGLTVIEDAAHGTQASYRSRPLGSIGSLGALSFHETKNVMCGEGGALAVNDPGRAARAEVTYEKGTDRLEFLRGRVEEYTWQDVGSSYALSDLSAAFLLAQLEGAEDILARRMAVWLQYQGAFADLEHRGLARRPIVPEHCRHSAHLYYLLLANATARDACLHRLNEGGVQAVFHYVPLHSSPAGRRYGRAQGDMPVTADVSSRLIRLPLWTGMEQRDIARVIDAVCETASMLGEMTAPAGA